MKRKRLLVLVIIIALSMSAIVIAQHPAFAWTPTSVPEPPLVRMPGTQPGDLSLDDANQCANCHKIYHAPALSQLRKFIIAL